MPEETTKEGPIVKAAIRRALAKGADWRPQRGRRQYLFLYALECGDFVKIGITRRPKARVRQLCTQRSEFPRTPWGKSIAEQGLRGRLLWAIPVDSHAAERATHERFSHERVAGTEWFRKGGDCERFVLSIDAGRYGIPGYSSDSAAWVDAARKLGEN